MKQTISLTKLIHWGLGVMLFFTLTGCNLLSSSAFQRNEAVTARINLALAYLSQNEFAKAKENIDKAMAHDPNDYLPYSVQAYYFQKINDAEKAKMSYQKAIALSEKQSQGIAPDLLNNYGTFLCEQQDFTGAYQAFESVLATKTPYYYEAETLENIATCASVANNRTKLQQALTQLKQQNSEKAKQLSIKLKEPLSE